MSSLSSTLEPLKAISGGCAGVEPAREHDEVGREPALGAVRPSATASVCGSARLRRSLEQRDVVPEQLVADDVALALDDLAHAQRDVVDRDLVLQPVALAVDRALVEAGQVEDRLADRLRRDRAGVHAGAADRRRGARSARRACRASRTGWPPSGPQGRSRRRRGRTRAHEPSFSVTERSRQRRSPLVSTARLRTVSRAPARSRRADRPCRRSPSSPGRRRSRAGRPCRRGTPRPGRGSRR